MKINGQPYVVGESAERHGVHTQRTGAARYTRDYYGLFAAAALGRLYERGGKVRVKGVTQTTNAILHPWFKEQIREIPKPSRKNNCWMMN
jgi:hypothetical protein